MALDIVSGSEVQTQASGVKISPQAFRSAALAKGAVIAGAGEDTSSLLTSVADKMQQVRNTKYVSDADIAIKNYNQAQEAAIMKQPNPDKWADTYKLNAKQWQDDYFASHPELGSDVKNHLTNMFQQSQASTAINLATAGNKRTLSDTNDSLELRKQKDISDLNEYDARVSILAKLNSGVIDQKEYENELAQLPSQMDSALVTHRMGIDAASTLNDLDAVDKNGKYANFKNLSEDERRIKRTQVERQASVQESELADKLNQKVATYWANRGAGGLPFTAESLQKEYVSKGKLKQSVANTLMRSLEGSITPQDQAGYLDVLRSKISKMPINLSKADLIKNKQDVSVTPEYLGLPAETQKLVMDEIGLLNEPSGNPNENKTIKMLDTYDKQGLLIPYEKDGDKSYQFYDEGIEGLKKLTSDEVKEKFGVTKDELLKGIDAEKINYQRQIRSFYKNNKDATEEDGNEYLLKQIREPQVYDAIQQKIIKFKKPEEITGVVKPLRLDTTKYIPNQAYKDKAGNLIKVDTTGNVFRWNPAKFSWQPYTE